MKTRCRSWYGETWKNRTRVNETNIKAEPTLQSPHVTKLRPIRLQRDRRKPQRVMANFLDKGRAKLPSASTTLRILTWNSRMTNCSKSKPGYWQCSKNLAMSWYQTTRTRTRKQISRSTRRKRASTLMRIRPCKIYYWKKNLIRRNRRRRRSINNLLSKPSHPKRSKNYSRRY